MALVSVLALLGTGEILALPGPESEDYLDGGVGPAPRDRTSSPLLNRHYQGLAPNTAPPVSPTPGREIFERRFQIVYTAQVRQGLRIADFSPGTGDITVLFARAVGPEGRVYAVDPSPAGVARLQTLAQEYHVTNIEPILNPGEDTQLPPAGIDLAFLGDTAYGSGHGFDHGLADRSLLDSIRQALIPYGSLVVIGQRDLAAPVADAAPHPGALTGSGWSPRSSRPVSAWWKRRSSCATIFSCGSRNSAMNRTSRSAPSNLWRRPVIAKRAPGEPTQQPAAPASESRPSRPCNHDQRSDPRRPPRRTPWTPIFG